MKKDIHNNLIKFGSLHIENLRVLDISGDLVQVENFLKGQVTSDHEKMTEGAYQLSSICNHKGQVIADFIIYKEKDSYKFVVDESLQNILIDELTPFAKFNAIDFIKLSNIVIGTVSPSGELVSPYCSNDYFQLNISIKEDDFEYINSINDDTWQAANKILGNLFLNADDVGNFRPLEINYDNLRVSFQKGCYRGQEIVARMKYLGVDRRKFCTFLTIDLFQITKDIKVIGKIITLGDKKVFNAIIKKSLLEEIEKKDGIIKII